MAKIQIISPIDIATKGFLSNTSLTLATKGYIVFLEEEIIPPTGIDLSKAGGGGPPPKHPWEDIKKQKKITAIVTINGKKYSDTIITTDLELKLKDVKVEIIDTDTPSIRIILPKEDDDEL